MATYHHERNPDGLISFATAENALVTKELEVFVQSNVRLSDRDLLYASVYEGGPDFPPILAAHLNEFLKPSTPISPDQIRLTASATAAHDALAWALADPQDSILLSRPVYGRLELDFFDKSSVNTEYADTTAENCLDENVIDKFEEAKRNSESRGVKIKAVFIVNPHNPLGRCYPRQTLINILEFCQRHKIHLICDEIYSSSVFDSGEPGIASFNSILSINLAQHINPSLVHVTYGLSKDFGAAGLCIGCIITRSESLLAAMDGVSRFSGPSGPSLAVAKAMLGNREWCRNFLNQNRIKLATAYKHATAALRDMGIRYLPGTNAGFFLWVDLSPFLPKCQFPEFELAEKFKKAGVFLHPQEEHSLQPGWFRLVYTQDSRTMSEGFRRIKSVISQH